MIIPCFHGLSGKGDEMETGIYSIVALLESDKSDIQSSRLVVGSLRAETEGEARFEAARIIRESLNSHGWRVDGCVATELGTRLMLLHRGLPHCHVYAAGGITLKIDRDGYEYANAVESLPIVANCYREAVQGTMRRLTFGCPRNLGWRRYLVAVDPIPQEWIKEVHARYPARRVSLRVMGRGSRDDLLVVLER